MTNTLKKDDAQERGQQQNFSADMSRLLDIVANALYTNPDVFLRELISNAADACDRLRYEALTKPALIKDESEFRIHVSPDRSARTLTVYDNGIGMNDAELADHLGTIAKSGTARLMEEVNKDKSGADKLKLIGQFGVGFYASFMVASHVTVISRKAGEEQAWCWASDGRSGFTVTPANDDQAKILNGIRGTAIILDIKDDASEFLIEEKLRQTVEQYSDHISVPIYLVEPALREGQTAVNQASALWMRSKNDVTPEEYQSFYRHITHGFDEPVLTSHWRAEGKIEFSGLLFIPLMRPWDLYDPTRRNAVRLYVRRIFISDNIPNLMYPWLRFVRGVIDSEDLPLNISRETLQHNPLITKIRSAVTKKILNDLNKLSQDDEPGFIVFWGQFGAALKEGLYDAAEHRDDIFKLCRFFSSRDDGTQLTSLDDYIGRAKDGQKEIYYLSGEKLETIKNSPQLEGFKSRDLEVLFFTDTIDDFWLQNAIEYKGFTFRSITKGDINLKFFQKNGEQPIDNKNENEIENIDSLNSGLLDALKNILKDQVDDVRFSERLTTSPVCIVAPAGGVDMHMERVLKIHQQYSGASKPVLEINKDHNLIRKMALMSQTESFKPQMEDLAFLLLDQARIIQGEPIPDPARFARLMAEYLETALNLT
jgi:molecular chaperone HtpG